MSKLQINSQLFLSFLKTLQPRSEQFVFQTFTDDKVKAREYRQKKQFDPLACAFTATPEDALERLQPLQEKGAGVFVQANIGIGRGGKGITKVPNVFVDTDGAPLDPIVKTMPAPLGITSSSTGKYHVYWRAETPLDQFKPVQKALAIAFECDEAMVNLDRVVRVPGTWHLKDPSNPVQVGFIPGEDKTYTPDELLKYLPKATPTMDMNDALVTSGDRFEMPPELPAGDRTRHLISLAGQLAGQGYGVEYIKAEVKRTMLELCPEGQAPIDDTTLEIEIYPAIQKFVDSAAPEVPAPPPMLPDVPSVPGQGTNNDLPEMSLAERATRDVRELTNLEQFDAQLYYVEKRPENRTR